MPDSTTTVESAPSDNGTSADKPLNTSVADKLGKISEERLSALLRRSMSDEPAQAPAPDNKAETTSEETPADAEATDDTTTLQETVEDTSKEADVQTEAPVEEGLPKGAQKRIDKLTALRKEAEAKATQLEAQIADLTLKLNTRPATEDAPVKATADNPYLNLQSQAEVDSAFAEARRVRRWCEENADGATVKDKVGKETEYSAEDVRRIKLNALDALEEHLPKQLVVKKAPVQPTRSSSAPATVTAKERDTKNAEAKFRKSANSSNLKDLLLQQFL